MKTFYYLCILVGCFFIQQRSHATGFLFCTNAVNQKDTAMLSPVSMKVTTTIQDQIATTVVREGFSQTMADNAKAE